MNPRDTRTRAENVGSLLRSPEALRAAASRAPGDAPVFDSPVLDGPVLDGPVLGDPVLDAAVLDAIKLQRDAGVDIITDGELRRSNWADTPDYLDCFDKIAGNTGGLRWRGGENSPTGGHAAAYDTVARRVADAKRRGDRSAQYAFLAEHADVRTKFTLPAPSYHRRYWWDEVSGAVYGSAEEYLEEIRDALREVVDQVVGLGCDYIQLDAPNYGSLCDPDNRARMEAAGVDVDAQIAFDADLDSSLFAGLSGITRAVHVCRGNAPGGRWHSSGGYGAISAQLFPRLDVDRLLLEYDTERAGTFGPLADVPSGVIAVLGLLTTKSGALEDESAVKERIAEAATIKPLDEFAVSTQCGFASVASGNPVTPEQQLRKLELVAKVARDTWPEGER
jgi:5-methyltetrahydropteroyltriglutamate--homocysteine methyltransferase